MRWEWTSIVCILKLWLKIKYLGLHMIIFFFAFLPFSEYFLHVFIVPVLGWALGIYHNLINGALVLWSPPLNGGYEHIKDNHNNG